MSCGSGRGLRYSTPPAGHVPEVLDGSGVLWQRHVKVVVVGTAQPTIITLVIAAGIMVELAYATSVGGDRSDIVVEGIRD